MIRMNLSELPSKTARNSLSRAALTSLILSVRQYSFFTSCGIGSFLWKFICMVIYLIVRILVRCVSFSNVQYVISPFKLIVKIMALI